MAFGQVVIKLDTRNLDRLVNQLEPRAEKLLDKGARDVEARWKGYIREKHVIDTGAYLNSIHVVAEHKPLQREIADSVEYGIYQEYGTVHQPARPCAQPAVEDVKPSLLKAWGQLFR